MVCKAVPCSKLKLLGLTVIFVIISLNFVNTCNEAMCASIVSKCMLLGSCKCDLKTCSCCKDCFYCLSFLFDECCSCFDLCPKRNFTNDPLSKKSHIEDFDVPFPELFQSLTRESDDQKRWTSLTYPVDIPNKLFDPQQEKIMKYRLQSSDSHNESNDTEKFDTLTINCTVAFLSGCNSWQKCKQSCRSMGANSYRWFHDGCCECVGDTCINYGVDESRCFNCTAKTKPDIKNEEEEEEEEYDDYGQDDDFDEDEL